MEIVMTGEVPEYPQLRRHERRCVLGFSTDPGYGTYYVMLDENCRSGPEARVVPIPAGCCDIRDGCLPPSWSLDHHWVQSEQRTVIRLGPHAWVANWAGWMQRLALGDEATLIGAWQHAECRSVLDDG